MQEIIAICGLHEGAKIVDAHFQKGKELGAFLTTAQFLFRVLLCCGRVKHIYIIWATGNRKKYTIYIQRDSSQHR